MFDFINFVCLICFVIINKIFYEFIFGFIVYMVVFRVLVEDFDFQVWVGFNGEDIFFVFVYVF